MRHATYKSCYLLHNATLIRMTAVVDEASAVEPFDDLIGVHDAAEMFSVHHTTLRQWIKSGTVPSTRMPNGRIRLSRRWVQRRIEEMAMQAQSDGQEPVAPPGTIMVSSDTLSGTVYHTVPAVHGLHINTTASAQHPVVDEGDVKEMVDVLGGYFSEYGSKSTAKAVLRVLRAFDWMPDDNDSMAKYIRWAAGEINDPSH